MAWCDRCYSDHDGPCLEDRKRVDLGRELAELRAHRSEPCPFCGGRGSGGPFGFDSAAASTCAYCRGTGRATA